MPFFASLWTQERRYEFATNVADSVSRVASLGLLAASAMIALGRPVIELIFVGGRFNSADASQCAAYFAVFSIALFLWSAQAIYARAFYAAGNTFVPMIASTIVTAVSIFIYASLHAWLGVMGLAVASDIGITLQAGTIAVLLHQRRMVSIASLDYAEMGRCLLAGLAGGGAVWVGIVALRNMLAHLPATPFTRNLRLIDLVIVAAGSTIWLFAAKWVLEKTGSALPRVARKRLRLG